MEPKFKVGDVIMGVNGVKGYVLKIMEITYTYVVEIVELPNRTTEYKIGEQESAGSFLFIDDNYILRQPYLNEQKLKKVLGL